MSRRVRRQAVAGPAAPPRPVHRAALALGAAALLTLGSGGAVAWAQPAPPGGGTPPALQSGCERTGERTVTCTYTTPDSETRFTVPDSVTNLSATADGGQDSLRREPCPPPGTCPRDSVQDRPRP